MRTEIEFVGGPHDGETSIAPGMVPQIDRYFVADPMETLSALPLPLSPELIRYRLLYDDKGKPRRTREGRLCYVPIRG